MWAYCFRLGSEISADECFGSTHDVIENMQFINGKRVKRLEKAIRVVMKFLNDKLGNQVKTRPKGRDAKKLLALRERHNSSMFSPEVVIIQDGASTWHVQSSTTIGEMYLVQRNVDCSSACSVYCAECKACIHNYKCSCVDYSEKNNMCKHIHLVCQTKDTIADVNAAHIVDAHIVDGTDDFVSDIGDDAFGNDESDGHVVVVQTEDQLPFHVQDLGHDYTAMDSMKSELKDYMKSLFVHVDRCQTGSQLAWLKAKLEQFNLDCDIHLGATSLVPSPKIQM